MPWTTTLPSTVATSPVRAATASKGLDNGGPHVAITHGMLIAVVSMTMFFAQYNVQSKTLYLNYKFQFSLASTVVEFIFQAIKFCVIES